MADAKQGKLQMDECWLVVLGSGQVVRFRNSWEAISWFRTKPFELPPDVRRETLDGLPH